MYARERVYVLEGGLRRALPHFRRFLNHRSYGKGLWWTSRTRSSTARTKTGVHLFDNIGEKVGDAIYDLREVLGATAVIWDGHHKKGHRGCVDH